MILNFTAAGFTCLTIFFGYNAAYDVNYFVAHIYIALIAASLTILGQVAIFFYLLATGASIKEAFHEYKIDFGRDALKETREFKKKVFPFAMFTILLAIAVTALGGAVHTGMISQHVHGTAAWCLACCTIFSTFNAGKCFKKNKPLIMKVIEVTTLHSQAMEGKTVQD